MSIEIEIGPDICYEDVLVVFKLLEEAFEMVGGKGGLVLEEVESRLPT